MDRKHRTTTKEKEKQKRKNRTTRRNRIKSDVTPIVTVVDSNPNEYQDFSEIQDINELKDGKTPLCEAVIDNNPALVEQLLAVPDIDVNIKTNDGRTPLYIAISNSYTKNKTVLKKAIEIIKMLLKAPSIDVNDTVFDEKITPLYLAVQLGKLKIVKMLLAYPDVVVDVNQDTVDVNQDTVDVNQDTVDGQTPLFRAVISGNTKIVKMLLADPDIDVNQVTTNGETPLIRAASLGYSDIVQMLLNARDIDIDHVDNDNDTALSISKARRHTDIENAIKNVIVRKQRIAFKLLNYDAPINSKSGFSQLPRNIEDYIFSFNPKGGKKTRKIKRARYY